MSANPRASPSPDMPLAFELAHVSLVLSRQRIINDCNQCLCELFGAQPCQWIEPSFRLLYPSAEEYEQMDEHLTPLLKHTRRARPRPH